MSFLNRLFGREQRAASIKSSSPYLAAWFGNRTGTGAFVNVSDGSGLAVAHACVGLISSTLASMPLNLHRRETDGGREVAREHPLHGVLHDLAGESLTAFEAREAMIADLLIHGNALSEITWSGRGQVTALRPINWMHVTVEKSTNNRPRFVVMDGTARRVILADDALYLRYRVGPDGLTGQSPIQLARASFNLAIEQEKQAHKQAERAFRPSGVLNLAHAIDDTGKAGILDSIAAKAEDTSGKGGVLVIDGGSEWTPTAFNSRDSEFLESRKLSDLAIARVFHVPPTAVGITDNATYSNVDGENRAFVSRCLSPLARRVEQAMNNALLPSGSRSGLYIEHDLAALLRGDLTTRFTAYGQAIQNGFMTPNEIRQRENMPTIAGADDLLSPLNMTTAGGRDESDVE